MVISKVRMGMRVVPHAKTADGAAKGLENSVVWVQAQNIGQPFLYVTSKPFKGEYPICVLSLERGMNHGDYYLAADFEPYKK